MYYFMMTKGRVAILAKKKFNRQRPILWALRNPVENVAVRLLSTHAILLLLLKCLWCGKKRCGFICIRGNLKLRINCFKQHVRWIWRKLIPRYSSSKMSSSFHLFRLNRLNKRSSHHWTSYFMIAAGGWFRAREEEGKRRTLICIQRGTDAALREFQLSVETDVERWGRASYPANNFL